MAYGGNFIYPVHNYLYLHHLKKYIFLPVYPESISDSTNSNYTPNSILMRSAPLYAYSSSGPRTMTISLKVHREVLNDINVESLGQDTINYYGLNSVVDYGDVLVRSIEACALPKYSGSQKMVNPPIVSLKLGDNIYITGVVNGGVSATYSGPILNIGGADRYAEITLSFSVNEITPYDASDLLDFGSYRIKEDIERNIYTLNNNGAVSKALG